MAENRCRQDVVNFAAGPAAIPTEVGMRWKWVVGQLPMFVARWSCRY